MKTLPLSKVLASATPLPFRKHETLGKVFASLRGANNEFVADCGSRSDAKAQANAALLAHAANSLPELVATLSEIEKKLDAYQLGYMPKELWPETVARMVNMAQDALAKANAVQMP